MQGGTRRGRWWLGEEELRRLWREARRRWSDFKIVDVRIGRSKQTIIAELQGGRVKLIVYRDGRIRAYGRIVSAEMALKRMAARVLGHAQGGADARENRGGGRRAGGGGEEWSAEEEGRG